MENVLNARLAEIQKKLKAPKSQYNNFGKYAYRNAEDILNAVKPLLVEGETITLRDEIVVLGDAEKTRFYVKATAKLSNGKESMEVSAYAREEETKKGMDGSQITGASSSYARKYALNGLFAIDDTKDSDTTNNKTDVKEIPSELVEKIRQITTVEELKEVYTEHKGLGKEFAKLITDQKNFINNANKNE